jgi:hypothetical protein
MFLADATTDVLYEWLKLLSGYVALALVGGAGAVVIIKMATNKINLAKLISEPNGDASMSRFQLLIFTFVIAMSLFLIIVTLHQFPATIPQGILVLLGISSSSYLVSKGIQFSQPDTLVPPPDITVKIHPEAKILSLASPPVALEPIPFSVDLTNDDPSDTITWTLTPAGVGSLDTTTGTVVKYTPPPLTRWPTAGQMVKLSAASTLSPNSAAVATIQF